MERRVEITDKTLVALWDIYGDKLKKKIPELRELTTLIYVIGSDYIEITPKLYDLLFPLPEGIEFRVNVKKEIYIDSGENVESAIYKYSDASILNNARIVGLDDLIMYNYRDKFSLIKSSIGKSVEMSIGNSKGCSTALTLEWIRNGGKHVITSFAGIGGYTPLEELLCSIDFLQKVSLRGDHKLLPRVMELFEDITGEEIPENKPLIGKRIFDVESGIHVDGILKNPKSFEPYEPSKIGKAIKIIIGKFSGNKAIKIKLNELNIPYNDKDIDKILNEVRTMSTKKKRSLDDSELIEICNKLGA